MGVGDVVGAEPIGRGSRGRVDVHVKLHERKPSRERREEGPQAEADLTGLRNPSQKVEGPEKKKKQFN